MLATLLPAQRLLDRTQTLDFIAPLQGSVGVSFTRLPEAIRVAPVEPPLGVARRSRGITLTEVIGAVLLLIGLATRWISIPLMITMLVATFTVHWPYGWSSSTTASSSPSPTSFCC
jgi:uncharacterized membrane protein YphA (DoxX/SURF4 family)